jgi:phage tail-like protein
MGARASDPVIGFHFSLELSGKVTGYFTEISGLGSETEIVEHKVVNDKGIDSVQKIPGRLKWGDITLKRGVTAAMDFWQWRKQVEDGNISGARANGSIIMMDQALKPVAQWDFTNGWPSKVSGPTVQSDSNAFGVEEMTIVHEGIVRVL